MRSIEVVCTVIAVFSTSVAGCRTTGDSPRNETSTPAAVDTVTMRVETLYIEQQDYAKLEDVWTYVDELAFGASKKALLNRNGLRVGVARALTLDEVVWRLRDAVKKRSTATVDFSPGVRSLAVIGEPMEGRYLFLVSASGLVTVEPVAGVQMKMRIRVTEAQGDSVRLRLTSGMYDQADLRGDIPLVEFGHLQFEALLRPNQIVLVGPLPTRRNALGGALYRQPESDSEQQMLVILYPVFN